MSNQNVYQMVEDFRSLIKLANQKQQENIPYQQKEKEIRAIIDRLEESIQPISKALGQKTEKEFVPLQTKFADLLSEYMCLESQYKNQPKNDTKDTEILNPDLIQAIELNPIEGDNNGMQQLQQLNSDDEITYLQEETHEIATSVRQLNETMELLNDELSKQSNRIGAIEVSTHETLVTMEKGNDALDQAKKDQAKCRI